MERAQNSQTTIISSGFVWIDGKSREFKKFIISDYYTLSMNLTNKTQLTFSYLDGSFGEIGSGDFQAFKKSVFERVKGLSNAQVGLLIERKNGKHLKK